MWDTETYTDGDNDLFNRLSVVGSDSANKWIFETYSINSSDNTQSLIKQHSHSKLNDTSDDPSHVRVV